MIWDVFQHQQVVALETSGHTLIETMVALALLVTVLAPAGMVLGHIVTERQAARQSEALTRAESALERMIVSAAVQEEPFEKPEGRRWRVDRLRRTRGGLIQFRVAVYWKDEEAPMVVLQTARQAP